MEPLGAGDPQAVGRYRLLCRLGSGGMGQVFLGESPVGRRVAVKLVRKELASSPGFRERFRREAKLAMRAGGFWAAEVVDADPDAAVPWIASEYVDGPSLTERVARQGPLDEAEVRGLGSGLAQALASFHRAGLVHRDLKPSNVLLVDDGPRVIDFGISKALEPLDTAGGADLTRAGTILGTPGFMAPEQALGQPAGPAADVFSLGSLLVYAATGEGPFGEGPSHALLFRVVYEEPELGGLPYGLRELVLDCLRKAAEERPAAEALVARLVGPQPQRQPQRQPEPEPAPTPAPTPAPWPTAVPDPRVALADAGTGTPTGVPTGAPTGPTSMPTNTGTDAPAAPPKTGPLPAARVTTGPRHGSSDGPDGREAPATAALSGSLFGSPIRSLTRSLSRSLPWSLLRRGDRPARGRAAVSRPAEMPPVALVGDGSSGFTVEKWEPEAFRRRMRRPVQLALALDLVLAVIGIGGDVFPVVLGVMFLVTLLCLLYGLRVSLPLRQETALHVGPDGLSVQRGSHRLTVPWRDVATVGFAREKNKRGLALTATLADGVRTEVPRQLRGARGMLKCKLASPFRKDAKARAQDLETALRSYAGDRFRSR